DDVAGGADAVVVAGPATDADVLGHGDLDVVHVAAVPDRLVQRVREPQRQDVLDRLLAQVMVDAEDRVRPEHRVHYLVELPRAGQVVADLREVLVLPVPAGEADQGETRRQQPAIGQVVDGGHQLLAGQVTGNAEQDKDAGPGHPRYPPVPRVPQRVGPAHRPDPVAP